MKIFYGAAIQGARNREERAEVHRILIEAIKKEGCEVVSEHTTAKSKEEAATILERSIGPLPSPGIERGRYVRKKMIEAVESNILAAIFEVSTPGLGTGIEIAHAYLRPRLGLKEIPILALYEKNYWPNNLTTMIRGITKDEVQSLQVKDYTGLEDAKSYIKEFLRSLR